MKMCGKAPWLLIVCAGLWAQNSIPDHTGTLSYKRLIVNPPDTSGLYHVNGYVCSDGSEHYAPDCVPEDSRTSEVDIATLKLDDGRVISITGTPLAGLAKVEAMSQGDTGTWSVTYRLLSERENPITHHLIEIIQVVFPIKINGKTVPISKRLSVDKSSEFLSAMGADD